MLLLFAPMWGWGQAMLFSDTLEAGILRKQAYIAREQGDYQAARAKYREAQDIYLGHGLLFEEMFCKIEVLQLDAEGLRYPLQLEDLLQDVQKLRDKKYRYLEGLLYSQQAWYCSQKQAWTQSAQAWQEALRSYQSSHLDTKASEYIELYLKLGQHYQRVASSDSSMYWFDQALALHEYHYPERSDKQKATIYIGMAKSWQLRGAWDKAEEYQQLALHIQKQLAGGKTSASLIEPYWNYANWLFHKGDEQALDYARQALDLSLYYHKQEGEKQLDLLASLIRKATELGALPKAQNYCLEALRLPLSRSKENSFLQLFLNIKIEGTNYSRPFTRVLREEQLLQNKEALDYSMLYYQAREQDGKLEEAEVGFKNLGLLLETTIFELQKSRCELALARIASKKGNFEQGLALLPTARALQLTERGPYFAQGIELLEKHLEICLLAGKTDAAKSLRLQLIDCFFEGRRHIQQKKIYEVYAQKSWQRHIREALLLLMQQGGQEQLCFELIMKKQVLEQLFAYTKRELPDYSGAAYSFVEAEKQLEEKLEELRWNIYRQLPQEAQLDSFKRLEGLLGVLQKKSLSVGSAYWNLRYAQELPSLADFQSGLKESLLCLGYLYLEGDFFRYSIDRAQFALKKLDGSEDLGKHIRAFRSALSDTEGLRKRPEANCQALGQSGYALYKVLLADALPENNSYQSLAILPDAALWSLPFAAFSSEEPRTQSNNFSSLPYLIFKYRIQYLPSLLGSIQARTSSLEAQDPGVFALGPNYENLGKYASGQIESYQRSLLRKLRLSELETRRLRDFLPGLFLFGAEAKEVYFEARAEDYTVLHLAAQYLENTHLPLAQAFALSESPDVESDDMLFAWEISRLCLSAQLTVLSLYQHRVGGFWHEELQHAISPWFYAGSQALLVNLWDEPEEFRLELLEQYYRKLNKGLDKDQALQYVQLEHLRRYRNLEQSHPIYWANWTQWGEEKPINIGARHPVWLYTLLAALVAGIILGTLRSYSFKYPKPMHTQKREHWSMSQRRRRD